MRACVRACVRACTSQLYLNEELIFSGRKMFLFVWYYHHGSHRRFFKMCACARHSDKTPVQHLHRPSTFRSSSLWQREVCPSVIRLICGRGADACRIIQHLIVPVRNGKRGGCPRANYFCSNETAWGCTDYCVAYTDEQHVCFFLSNLFASITNQWPAIHSELNWCCKYNAQVHQRDDSICIRDQICANFGFDCTTFISHVRSEITQPTFLLSLIYFSIIKRQPNILFQVTALNKCGFGRTYPQNVPQVQLHGTE